MTRCHNRHTTRTRWMRAFGIGACATALGVPRPAVAQTDVEELGRVHGGARPPPAYYETLRRDPTAFQFSAKNGWIVRAHALAAARRAERTALSERVQFSPQANFNAAGVMRGDVNVPVFLILYSNTDSLETITNLPRATMETRLYGTQPAPPYSIHTYYREISNDSLLVNGTVLEWTRVPGADSVYEGGCNGLCSNADIPELMRELVMAHDNTVDFGQFDNDGPDGIPNSADDDGFVDAVVLLHPEVDGACVNINSLSVDNIWAHRWSFWGRLGIPTDTLHTNDVSNSGRFANVVVNDYIIQGGQGGDEGCTSDFPQAMGVVAHETGHLFGLPDLYDTSGEPRSQGIGHWGLMGSGNWRRAYRPAHMEAWSRAQLGWVSEIVLASDTTLDLSPIEIADTAFVLPLPGSDQYFLLENRQPIGSDSLMHGPGLLIWHVDPTLINARRFSNSVNAQLPHGLALEQADALGELQLESGGNRGDAGDPYPGTTSNTVFGAFTNPASDLNDGTPTYVKIDSIGFVSGTQTVRARIRFQRPSLVLATDTLATFRLDGTSYNIFSGLLDAGTDYQLEMDSVQVVNNGGNRYTWQSWSNGQPRSHTFTASANGDSIVATVTTEYLVQATVDGSGGVVASTPSLDLTAGEFLPEDAVVQLVASVTTAGHVFEGWTGDTTTASDTLDLVLRHPYRLTATFAPPLTLAAEGPPTATMGAPYQYQLPVTGGVGSYGWSVVTGTLPDSISLTDTGALTGLPRETGTFQFEVGVSSGSQSANRQFQLEVVAPALLVANVVAQVAGVGNPLSVDEITYLDLLGNENNALDVGDFLAWVATGAAPVAPETVREVVRAARRGAP